MDYIKILKRAWETTWSYRVLWIFGIILAITTGGAGGSSSGSGGSGSGGNGGNGNFPPGEFPFDWPPGDLDLPQVGPTIVSTLVIIGIGLACLALILIVVGIIARYVAETALIGMVDEHEETGQKRTIREGFRLGWSRTALRLFLIKLLITLPTIAAFILLFLIAGAPLLGWIPGITAIGVIGTVTALGLLLLVIFLAIIVSTVLSLLVKFFWRACVLEGLGVTDSIQYGFDLMRRNLKDVVIMWLIMIGVRIGWAIALILITILLIPVILLLVVVGLILGGLPAGIVWGLTSLLFNGPVPWILAGLIGLPIFILIVAAPWIFLGGLMEVFKSSVWTLTYRELHALERLTDQAETELEPQLEPDIWMEPEPEGESLSEAELEVDGPDEVIFSD